MQHRLLGFFSGFPARRFPSEVAERLGRELPRRESLVFISAWPDNHQQNDSDSVGMHQMFVEYGLSFSDYHVIDSRTEPPQAVDWVHKADCLFLMGGHPGLQFRLLRDTGVDEAIRRSGAVVLGVSAGAINMAKRSLDTKESPVPYAGLGLADVTVKPHFRPEDRQVLSTLLAISAELPICAMEDDSAIFVAGKSVSCTGNIHWVNKGGVSPFSPDCLFFHA